MKNELNFAQRVMCLSFANGKRHDFRLFKESNVHVHPRTMLTADTGYQGLAKLHLRSRLPKKRSKRHPLSKVETRQNRSISRECVFNEHIIG